MIGHHDTDAGCLGLAHRLHRGDAAIAGDDQRRPDRPGEGEAGGTEVVSVPQPMRDEAVDIGARFPERAGEERGGRLAVHVVIPVHQDGLTPRDRGGHGGHRGVEPGERPGIDQLLERGAEEAPRRVGAGVTALDRSAARGTGMDNSPASAWAAAASGSGVTIQRGNGRLIRLRRPDTG